MDRQAHKERATPQRPPLTPSDATRMPMIPETTSEHNPSSLADPVCPHCGCDTLPTYEDEGPICPHCGAILTTPSPDPPTWLSQWPQRQRGSLVQLFYTAVRTGRTDPATIVAHGEVEVRLQLDWATDPAKREVLQAVLDGLQYDPVYVLDYAAHVLAREQLPAAEKGAAKREQAKTFVLEAMRGKSITEKQRGLLRAKGYVGPVPRDRAEASQVIGRLLAGKG
jgi:hypothetical protein